MQALAASVAGWLRGVRGEAPGAAPGANAKKKTKAKKKKEESGTARAAGPGTAARAAGPVVGLFVHTWHAVSPSPRRVQTETSLFEKTWYWWGRPAWGDGDLDRYSWSDDSMIDYHVDNWKALGVDFVFLDFTNGTQLQIMEGAHALCRRLAARGDGPKVAWWIRDPSDAPLFRREFYDRYPSLPFRWRGKPLLLVRGEGGRGGDGRPPPGLGWATARWCWGLLGPAAGSMWSFKEARTDPPAYVHDGRAEHVGLAFATQATHMTTPAGRRCRDGGDFFDAQLEHARGLAPQVVTITGYNEWMAINLGAPRDPVFTDLWGPDCSHDIEPMKGGHGDAYFRQARRAVAAIKAWGRK